MTPLNQSEPAPRVRLATADWIAVVGLFWTPFTAIVALFVSMWTRIAVVETRVDAHERWLNSQQAQLQTIEEGHPRVRQPVVSFRANP